MRRFNSRDLINTTRTELFLPRFQLFTYSKICPYFNLVKLERFRTQYITSIPDTEGVASINFSGASASVSELFEFPYNNIDQLFSFCRIPSTGAPVFFFCFVRFLFVVVIWLNAMNKMVSEAEADQSRPEL